MAKTKLPFLSIIIPAFNSINHYKPLLKSLLNINYPDYEIIIVDDGSTDGSYEKIREMSKKNSNLRIIKTLRKKGIPGSRNLGIEASKGDLLAFLDMDMEAGEGWPGELVKILLKDSSIGGVLPKVLDFHRREIYQCAGFRIIPQSGWVIPRAFGYKDMGQFNKTEQVAIGAAASVIRKEALREIKGFDETLGNFDDIDLGWRLRLFGWKTLYVPDSIIYHWTAKPWSARKKTNKSSSELGYEFYLDNLLRMLIKNYELKNLFRYLPQAIAIMVIRAIINLFRGTAVPLVGVTKSLIWNIFMLPDTLKERAYIQKNRKIKDEELLHGDTFVEGNFFTIYFKYLRPLMRMSTTWPALYLKSRKNF